MSPLISLAFQVSIFLTVFGFGLNATREILGWLVNRPRLLFLSLLAMFVLMPVVALALAFSFDLPVATKVALVMLSVAPIPQLLPTTEQKAGGRAEYSYSLSVVVALLAAIIVPTQVGLIGRITDRELVVPPGTVETYVIGTILIPLAAGLALQAFAPGIAARIRPVIVPVANAVLSAACLLVVPVILPVAFGAMTFGTIAAILAFIVAGLAIGHLMAGPERADSIVLAVACVNRNPGIAIAIASASYPAESFSATAILYVLLVSVVSKPYVDRQKRRLAAERAPANGLVAPTGS